MNWTSRAKEIWPRQREVAWPLLMAAMGCFPLFSTCGSTIALAQDPISSSQLKSHVSRLASDEVRGRGTGETGAAIAEKYVAREFRKYGLDPVPGNESFFLPFDLYRAQFDPERTRLRLAKGDGTPISTHLVGDGFRVFTFSDGGEADGEIVFAGYGVSAPDLGYDDYEGLDVEGKFVLVLRHEPQERDVDSAFDGAASSAHALFTSKAAEARRRGALGMLLVTDPLHHSEADDFRTGGRLYIDPEDAMEEVVARDSGQENASSGAGSGNKADSGNTADSGERETSFLAVQISKAIANRLLSSSGRTLLGLQQEIEDHFMPVHPSLGGIRVHLEVDPPADIRIIPARNVAGFLEGSDPTLRDQWVVIGAHHDHLGAFQGSGDTVYNGADDNASGVAGVLQIAETLSRKENRPRRSIVFTTFSAEESGLLGSKAMVDQAQIQMDKVVFMFNFDMIGRNPHRPLTIMGDGFSPGMSDLLESMRDETDVAFRLSGRKYQGNSDHGSFYDADIPFLNFFTGLHDDYHQLTDHVSYLDFPRMESIVRLGLRVAKRVANHDQAYTLIHNLPWLGIHAELGVKDGDNVAFISALSPGSEAETAGLMTGDIIQSVNETPVTPPRRVGALLRSVEPGQSAKLSILRSGAELEIEVDRAHAGYLGIFPESVDEDQQRNHGLKSNEGVLVRQVVSEGPAAKSGLKSGDIILQIAGRLVDPTNLRDLLAQIGARETVDIIILRSGERVAMNMTLGERPRRR